MPDFGQKAHLFVPTPVFRRQAEQHEKRLRNPVVAALECGCPQFSVSEIVIPIRFETIDERRHFRVAIELYQRFHIASEVFTECRKRIE